MQERFWILLFMKLKDFLKNFEGLDDDVEVSCSYSYKPECDCYEYCYCEYQHHSEADFNFNFGYDGGLKKKDKKVVSVEIVL